MTTPDIKPDAPYYTEEELDRIEAHDPLAALRIAREQAALRRELEFAGRGDPNAPMPAVEEVRAVLEDARRILLRDGGDLEFVALEQGVLSVRLKGNCAGCPRSTLDLKQIVERVVRRRYPQIEAVKNVF